MYTYAYMYMYICLDPDAEVQVADGLQWASRRPGTRSIRGLLPNEASGSRVPAGQQAQQS